MSCYSSDGVRLLRDTKLIIIVQVNSVIKSTRTVRVKFMVDKVAVEQTFLRILPFHPVSIMPSLPETQSGKIKERPKSIPVSEISKHWTEKYLILVFFEVFERSQLCGTLSRMFAGLPKYKNPLFNLCVRANVLHVISVRDCCHRVTTQLQVTNSNNNNNNNYYYYYYYYHHHHHHHHLDCTFPR